MTTPVPETHTTSQTPEVHQAGSVYEVSCLPEGHRLRRHLLIFVARRGNDLWVVSRDGSCLTADGRWNYEPRRSDRPDDWPDRHYFDFETAVRLAREAAPVIRLVGPKELTAAEILEREASR